MGVCLCLCLFISLCVYNISLFNGCLLLQFYDAAHRKLQKRKSLEFYNISAGMHLKVLPHTTYLSTLPATISAPRRGRGGVWRGGGHWRRSKGPTALQEAKGKCDRMTVEERRLLNQHIAEAERRSSDDDVEMVMILCNPSQELEEDSD